jgi:AraC-like DNA-binding protein
MPGETLAAAARALVRREIATPAFTQMIRPPPARMERLLRLHAAASRLAADASEILACPEVARAIEQELVKALIGCLTNEETATVSGARSSQRSVMRRFEEIVEANPGRPRQLTEICAAIGVSDRTLRAHCLEQLGISPQRYLRVRRMNLARRALIQAEHGTKTVTDIAVDFRLLGTGPFRRRVSATVRRIAFSDPPGHPGSRDSEKDRQPSRRKKLTICTLHADVNYTSRDRPRLHCRSVMSSC